MDSGLTDKKKTVIVDGNSIKVRDVLREMLTPQLLLGDKEDAVLLRVVVGGIKQVNALYLVMKWLQKKMSFLEKRQWPERLLILFQ